MLLRFAIVVFLVYAAGVAPAAEPFRIPVGAKLTSGSVELGGWAASGVVYAPYVQARSRLIAAVSASGWRLSHEIALGKRTDKTLLSFTRGRDELTLMVTRLAVNRTAFSYGLSLARERGKVSR